MSKGLLCAGETALSFGGTWTGPASPASDGQAGDVERTAAPRDDSRGPTAGLGDARPAPPSRTRASTARSRFPLTPLRTIALRVSSVKPMSRNWESLSSKPGEVAASLLDPTPPPWYCTDAPNTFDGLFRLGEGLRCGRSLVLLLGIAVTRWAASFFERDEVPKMDVADRRLNRDGVFGGSGGGVPSSDSVLPVSCFGACRAGPVPMYFARMNRSMAESTSSASMGTGGFLFSGLYRLLDAMFPIFRMF